MVKRYGCYDRADFLDAYPAMDGVAEIATGLVAIKQVSVPFAGSRSCQYRLTELGRHDPKCEGCAHKNPQG